MRHARKAAVRATMAMLLSATFATSSVGSAHAIVATGGASAPVAAVATRGTGGTAYVAARSKARPARKPVHKTRRPSPKPKPPKPGTPVPVPAPPVVNEAGVPSPAQTAG